MLRLDSLYTGKIPSYTYRKYQFNSLTLLTMALVVKYIYIMTGDVWCHPVRISQARESEISENNLFI